MEKNTNYSNFNGYYNNPPFTPYENIDPTFNNNVFDPMYQYEQSYMYYRYLTQAVEYKIKCKEFEKLYGKDGNMDKRIN